MAIVGVQAQLAKAQRVRLINFTDDEDYTQLYNCRFGIRRTHYRKTRTDGLVDRLEGLPEHYIEGDILITVPEITNWVDYATPVAGVSRQLAAKEWRLQITSRSGTTDTIAMIGNLEALDFVRPEKGLSMFHIRIDVSAGDITEP